MSTTCSKCGQPIDWALTPTQAAMPVDHQPNENGNLAVWREVGVLRCRPLTALAVLEPHEKRGMPHFATCPNWEKKR